MSFFKKLVMVDKPSFIRGRKDPVIDRRERLIESIKKQIEQLTHPKDKGRPWFSRVSDGYISTIKYFNKPLALMKDRQHFKVGTKEELLETYKTAMDAVSKGEFDEIIHQHMESIKPRAKRRASTRKKAA
jgi:hypothetical protein